MLDKETIYIGGWLNSGSPVIAEIMSLSGYDFVAIDVEHGPFDISDCLHILHAIKSGNSKCISVVRVSGNSYSEIKRYMDAGADGIICPLINSKEEALQLINSVKYYPEGKRGVGYSRSNDYGINIIDSIANDNKKSIVCVQIEHIDALDNLEDILSVEGIDAAMIGPYDLSSSMGLAGKLDHPRMEEAVDYILKVCIDKGVLPGIHVIDLDPDQVKQRIKLGYRFIAYSVDIKMISESSIKGLESIRS